MHTPLRSRVATEGASALFGRSVWDHDETFAVLLDRDGTIVDLNSSMAAGFGGSVADLKGTCVWDCMLPEDRLRLQELFTCVIGSGKAQKYESRGQGRWHGSVLRPCFGENGQVIGVSLASSDGRLWSNENEDSRQNEQRLRFTLESAKVGLWELDPETRQAWRSREHAEMFGYAPGQNPDWTLDVFLSHVYPEDRPAVESAIQRGLASGMGWSFECRIVGADSKVRWILTKAAVAPATSDRARRVTGIALDITERREAQAAARESELRFAALADDAPVLIWSSDLNKLCDFFNQPWLDFTGRTMEQELGNGWAEGVHPDDFARCLEVYTDSFDARRPFRMEYRLRRHDGEYRWILDHGVPRHRPDGTFAGYVGSCIDITEQKRAEQAVRDSESRLIGVIEGTQAATWEWNVQTGETVFNDRWAEILGYTLAELAPISIQTWLDLAHPDDLKTSEEQLAKVLAHPGLHYDCECRMKHRSGGWVWVHDRGKVVEWTADGKPLRMAGTHTDITGRKRLETALRESEQRYRAVVEDQTEVISRFEADGTFTFVNEVFCRFFGKSSEELVGHKWFPRAVGGDLPDIEAKLHALTPANPVVVVQNRVYAANDEVRWMEFVNRGFFDRNGQLVETQSVGRDITKMKLAEERIKETESRFMTFFRCSPVAAGIGSLETQKFIEVNAAFADMYGYEASEVVGHTAAELNLWPLPEQRTSLMQALQEHGRANGFEAKYRKKSGEIGDLTASAALIEFAGSRHIIGMMLDVTQRKRMEERLRLSEERYRLLFEKAGDAIMVVSPDHRILAANEAVCRQLGYTADELPRMSILQVATPEVLPRLPGIVETVQKQGGMIFESAHRRKDGSVISVEVHPHPIEWNGEDAALVICRDLTERKRTEERFRQAHKMEAVGRLAGGIAHEFNNILASMMMNLSLARVEGAGAELRQLLSDLEESCRRSAGLVKQMLAFSRQSVMNRQPMDMAEWVVRQAEALKPLLGERIEWELAVPNYPTSVRADRALLEQVLLNLCLNARDAMNRGGRLRLEVGLETVESGRDKTYLDAQAGRYLRLSVTDTGCGMDQATLNRLFEPFFTTKEVGQGTGLGLATVRGIVHQHQGWVEVESRLGKGSTFRIYLPTAEPAAPAVPATRPKKTGQAGGRTVLLVEDDERLRRLTKRLLTRQGYIVHEAADGVLAMALWADHRDDINLLLTDMVLPGDLSGLEIAERLRGDRPDLKVIITSGYNTDVIDIDTATTASMLYLPKPFAPGLLLDVISRCLGR